MRRMVFLTLLAAAAGGCSDDSTSPSLFSRVYALGRIGAQTPPIPQGPSGGAPFLLGDTLRLGASRSRGETEGVLTRIQHFLDGNQVTHRLVTHHGYVIDGNSLVYESCPLESACIASLIAAPVYFVVIGDSLFQTGPQASPLPGAVYGRVSGR
jgi:hypothetical protein